jgi:hypothetical protein
VFKRIQGVSSSLKKGSDPLRAFRFQLFLEALQRVRPLFQRAVSTSRPRTTQDRRSERDRPARKLQWLVLAGALPTGVLLVGPLCGDELKSIPIPQSTPDFAQSDEEVEPIRDITANSNSRQSANIEDPVPGIADREVADWAVATAKPKFDKRVLSQVQVSRLLTQARMELAVGELEMAHAFAEAAAEVEIPLAVFEKKPEFILGEIESVTDPQQAAELKVEAKPVAVPPAPDIVEKPAAIPGPVPEPEPRQEPRTVPETKPVPETKTVETVRVPSEPDWYVMTAKPKFDQAVLSLAHISRLLPLARMELAAGDLEMAHAFAEAAAEVDIPVEFFAKKPELILSEIEYVTARQQAVVRVSYDELPEGEAKNPNSPTERLKNDPRGFRAISKTALNVQPKSADADGEAQLLPDPGTQRRLALLPAIVQQTGHGRGWNPAAYTWQPPALYHSPLYFEEVELERYGNEYCGLQPVVSGVRFYLTPAVLPYQMGIEGNGPFSCHYDLGYNRPGECVPFSIHALPFSWTGALAQGAVATGLAFLIP